MTGAKKYLTFTYGCQMNEHDTEVMAGLLEEAGYRPALGPEEADLILINTCSVREKAENKVFGQLGQLSAWKRRRPGLIIGVAGCMAQRLGETLRRKAPQVDFVVGPGDLHRLPELVRRVEEERQFVLATGWPGGEPVENLPVRRADRIRAYVNISFGCNNFCSFCIVPYLRGPERSRRAEHILAEVEALAREGYREVMLLGQNVNTYGRDLPGGVSFGGLLQQVDAVEGLARIRYTTSHPRDFGPELVEVVASARKVCEHFHLPAQAGSDRVLERMRRGYTREHYLRLTEIIRRRLPHASITTDLIVGFPGETEEDFEATLDLVERVRFDAAFTFMYSPRPGTAAAAFPDQVPPEVRRERLVRLNRLQNRLTRESNERLAGETVEVLVEGPSKTNPERLSGRTRTNKIVVFSGPPELIGQLVNVRITEAQTFNLFGELV
ncbi:MAG: tRNA (N6-isopentenyl adenosine(37)-C2)-methylthiotransferase MiaB [Clostridia bacterium]|nr:tRNA (N6-isopentenyl adenosine(37)-C2)-methylthiotransferase MiaB [Clostridia bacterium]MDH7572915.1 tRNA (N6-isopentenyl adenosine(37)-C2)-methylthiotransferase MiaB [Clostridia bacterium]